MSFKRVKSGSGTSLQGYMMAGTKYEDLVATFGEPDEGADSKTMAEWVLLFEDKTLATIYDYKSSATRPEDVTRWHVGGFTTRAVDQVFKEVAEALKARETFDSPMRLVDKVGV